MKKLLITLALLGACKKKELPVESNTPPPIAEGKCLADHYEGKTATKQSCIYVGYNWGCVYAVGSYSCDRGTEANGERSAVQTILGK